MLQKQTERNGADNARGHGDPDVDVHQGQGKQQDGRDQDGG